MSGSDERMPKIDAKKLKQSDLDFIKYVEKQNLQRVENLKRLKRKNLRTASIIGFGVLGIYLYSMYAVKQENFLDDFEEPAKTIETNKN